jgi:nitrogen fixation protein FixH
MSGKGWYWPLVLAGLLVGSAGANIGFMLIATGDPTFAVEPDYYKKAIDWDKTMAQEARNAELGWAVSARLEGAARPGQGRLVARVTDRAGAPVSGARVAVEAFPSARARQVVTAALEPEGNGVYAGGIPLERPGLWELRVRVTRGEQVFTRTLSQDLAARP